MICRLPTCRFDSIPRSKICLLVQVWQQKTQEVSPRATTTRTKAPGWWNESDSVLSRRKLSSDFVSSDSCSSCQEKRTRDLKNTFHCCSFGVNVQQLGSNFGLGPLLLFGGHFYSEIDIYFVHVLWNQNQPAPSHTKTTMESTKRTRAVLSVVVFGFESKSLQFTVHLVVDLSQL